MAATAAGRRLGRKVSAHLLLVPFLIFALFPFYHMTLTSLKQNKELYDRTAVPLLIRQGPTLTHYTKLLWETEFLTWTKNSLLVTFLATALSLTIGTVAAYALARLQFFGVGGFGTAIFVTYLVPTSLLFLPLAQVVNWLGLADSKWALVVTYPTFLVPFCTWLLMGYFRTVPKGSRSARWWTAPRGCRRCGASCCPSPCPASSARRCSPSRCRGTSSSTP